MNVARNGAMILDYIMIEEPGETRTFVMIVIHGPVQLFVVRIVIPVLSGYRCKNWMFDREYEAASGFEAIINFLTNPIKMPI